MAARATAQHSHFRSDIEGLRGAAVLTVVAYHARLLWMTGGFVGVDVFFVLSGYLITGLLVKEHESSGRIDFVRFYGRRARRLLPAAALVLATTLLCDRVVLSPMEQAKFAWGAVATALYASNLLFMRQAADYFAADAESNPFLHTWSLAVEEQFYLVWPLLVSVGLNAKRPRRRLTLIVLVASAVSFVVATWLMRARQPWAFFGTPARAWEFGVGALTCLIPLRGLRRTTLTILGWAGLSAILLAAWAYTPLTAFPGVTALLPVVGTAIAIAAGGALPKAGVGRLLATRPLQFLGKQSYSWYLWHWPVLVLAGTYFPTMPIGGRISCALGSLTLATLTQRLVENPIRFHKRLVSNTGRSLGLAVGLTCASAVAAIGFHLWARHDERTGVMRPLAEAAATQPIVDLNGCVLGYTDVTPRTCVYGDRTSRTTVALFGDSHAAQWFPALDLIARRHGWRLVTLMKSSCPPARVPVFNKRLRRNYSECAEWRDEALAVLRKLRPAAVLVASFSRREASGLASTGEYLPTSYQEWEAGTRYSASAIAATGARAVFVRDTPDPARDIPICLARAFRNRRPATDCRTARRLAVDTGTARVERAALSGINGASTLDLTDQFCDSTGCDAVQRGIVVYRDNNHVSVSFAANLESVLDARLTTLLAQPAATIPPVQSASRGTFAGRGI